MDAKLDKKSIVKIYKEWSPGTVIPVLLAKVVWQEETTGKYGRGIHNHITDGFGNTLVITTWRTHMTDLKIDQTYILFNVVVDHFKPSHSSWYERHPWINKDAFWMSLPYDDGKAIRVSTKNIQEQYVTCHENMRMPYNKNRAHIESIDLNQTDESDDHSGSPAGISKYFK